MVPLCPGCWFAADATPVRQTGHVTNNLAKAADLVVAVVVVVVVVVVGGGGDAAGSSGGGGGGGGGDIGGSRAGGGCRCLLWTCTVLLFLFCAALSRPRPLSI